jgi:uncharacterized membrane protein
MNGRFLLLTIGMSLLTLTGCSTPPESETRPRGQNVLDQATLKRAQTGRVDFKSHIKPILETKCAPCHNQEALPGRMSLANHREAMRSGTLRGFIIPGQPDASPLLTRLQSAHTNVQAMPPVGESLTSDEVSLIKRWITQGAPWPEGPEGTLKTRVQ